MAFAASHTHCIVAALMVAAASAAHVGHILPLGEHVAHKNRRHELGFMRHGAVERILRICNAYPNAVALDVFHASTAMTSDGPMPYKSCRDFTVSLKVGDKIKFAMRGQSAGIFVMQALPAVHATLLLVIHRHDTVSTAVSFQSHVFARHSNAQVAIIDTYKGSGEAEAAISDKRADAEGKLVKTQLLRYNSLVSLSQGLYGVNLTEDGRSFQSSELVALSHENYVVLRTGIDAEEGESYPEELVVFPQSDLNTLLESEGGKPQPNGAHARPWLCCLLVALVVAVAPASL